MRQDEDREEWRGNSACRAPDEAACRATRGCVPGERDSSHDSCAYGRDAAPAAAYGQPHGSLGRYQRIAENRGPVFLPHDAVYALGYVGQYMKDREVPERVRAQWEILRRSLDG